MPRLELRPLAGVAALGLALGLALVAGCGTEPADPAAEPTAGSSVSASGSSPVPLPAPLPAPVERAPLPEVQTVQLSYAGGEAVGGIQRIQLTLGGAAELVVSGDAADELHLHGYDLYADVPAGGSGTIAFTADVPGVFELELHESGALLAQIEVS